eukprot:1260141-Pyramimonas_sp.AAC.1
MAPHAQRTPSGHRRGGTPNRRPQDPAPRRPGGHEGRGRKKTPLPQKPRHHRVLPARLPRSLPPASAEGARRPPPAPFPPLPTRTLPPATAAGHRGPSFRC